MLDMNSCHCIGIDQIRENSFPNFYLLIEHCYKYFHDNHSIANVFAGNMNQSLQYSVYMNHSCDLSRHTRSRRYRD